MTVCTMGDVVLQLFYANGRFYVMRIQRDKKQLVYFGNMPQCMGFIESVYAIYLENDLEPIF